MMDEAATHLLLAVQESVLMVPLAVLGLILTNQGLWFLAAYVPLVLLGTHVTWLFLLVVPRLYSAYTQVNEVDEAVDGYARTR